MIIFWYILFNVYINRSHNCQIWPKKYFAFKLHNCVDSYGILSTKFGFLGVVINLQTSPIAGIICRQPMNAHIPTVTVTLIFRPLDPGRNTKQEKKGIYHCPDQCWYVSEHR